MAIRTCDSPDCPRDYTTCVGATTTHEGMVLGVYERNGRDDSDFYATVWDPETGTVQHVEYASTRGWTYHNSATVDATPEVRAAAEVWFANQIFDLSLARLVAERETPAQRDLVRSVTTRGKNVGVEGVVMWRGETRSRYGTWSTGYRLGVKVEGRDKLTYLDADKVALVAPKPIGQDEVDGLAAACWYRAQGTNFRIA